MASPLDFEALLSREYRPARVTRLVSREAYHPERADKKKKNTSNQQSASEIDDEARRVAQGETSRLVLSLVTHTPAFNKHIPVGAQRDGSELLTKHPRLKFGTGDQLPPAAFHPLNLEDWEKKINWEGCEEKKDGDPQQEHKFDAMALLRRPRNPFLDNITFDNTTVSWEGKREDLLEKARRAPLILELGVAGQSVARHVYQNTVLTAQRPTPALKTEAYMMRMERDWTQPVTSTADISRGSLHADKDKMAALIHARQQKRAQMAEDKTNRVVDAMGTMALGGGKGRTITSSLMGPGGTERTGRPSRQMESSAAHDTEYIEQLDMVNTHSMVRDLSKLSLREYHRPKLPLSVIRQDLTWQIQIRFIPAGQKVDVPGNASSYQAIMSGTHAGAISKAKLRTEADLSPTEGKLVMLEYSEERPPIQLTKGMAIKVVNYFRGDKARCPVSAGGGDRPARRKRAGEGTTGKDSAQSGKAERPPRLEGPNRPTTLTDWIGKLPKKTQKDRPEKEAVDILPEGVTEALHPKVHGPFIGEVEEGTTVAGLISNLFVAPMFRQEPETTDFLMILTPPGGASRPGERESMGVILRDLPTSVYTVGQTEPRTRVCAPNTQGESNFLHPFISYQIARALARTQAREGHGLRFDELQDRVLPNLELPASKLRQRLKQVAVYEKNTMIWTTKSIGYEDYCGVDALGKSIAPEGVAAFETACAAARYLSDLGIHQLYAGSQGVAIAMVYLAGQLNAARELHRKTKKLGEISRSNKSIQPIQVVFYEKAAAELESYFKMLRQKHEIAKFIYEQLQLAPWHMTGEFIEVHKKAEGTGMMKLTGLGDPSGQGEGYSFIREVDSKPSKSVGSGALSAQMKKITGTEDDLRKLTMKQMASLLRSYGMAQKQIDTLKRWDRVHVIRDLSTKAASDGIGDGLERFARGEKMKLSEQKKMYRDRIQVIWRRQITALAMEGTDRSGSGGADGMASSEAGGDAAAGTQAAELKSAPDKEKDNSDSDSDDDDDLAAALEDEMMDRSEANQLVAAHAREQEGDGGLGQLRTAAQDQDLSKDAQELAALKRQREEERAAQQGLQSAKPGKDLMRASASNAAISNRKVIRKRITKTHPDGKQTTTFKFVLHPEEVGKILARIQQQTDDDRPRTRELTYEQGVDDKPPGHAMFEDEDDFEYSSRGRLHTHKRRGGGRRRGGSAGRTAPRARSLQIGKLKTKVSKEERMKKRRREEDELDVYTTSAKRKGTNNRKERGSIRDRRPHVIFSEKLEAIRGAIESRPYAGPFVKPVNRRLIPRYYEVISHPMDLQTIRDKISRYEYRAADSLVRDFELMKTNAIKFNGQASPITQEAIAIFEYVRDQIESSRSEFLQLEVDVQEQMSGKPKKKKKLGTKKSSASSSNIGMVGGVQVNLGNLKFDGMDAIDSDSDDSFSGLLKL